MSLKELLKSKKKIEKMAGKIKRDAERYKGQVKEFKKLLDELIMENGVSAEQVKKLAAFYESARMHRRPLDF
jgi:HSP90 family molecular chaperone